MESQDDRDFAAVIAAIADRRKVDRSGSIVITPMFQPMLDRISLTELRDYLFARYPNRNRRSRDRSEAYDLFEIGDRDLRSFDRAFRYRDSLRIVLGYNDAWETVARFKAILLNDLL